MNYVELTASAEQRLGRLRSGWKPRWTPRQDNVERANRYLGLSACARMPGTGWACTARAGYEDGFYDGKWDWELGVSYTRGPLTAAVS